MGLPHAVAVPVGVASRFQEPAGSFGVVWIVVRAALPVAPVDRVEGSVGSEVMAVVEQIVDGVLVGAVKERLPYPRSLKGGRRTFMTICNPVPAW